MRVLAHIHTFNDADIIERTVEAVRNQTRPPDGILIVDNASKDGTVDRAFPEQVTVIRNTENLGTSGAVHVGFQHALDNGFDWIWILDADSVPEPDALNTILETFAGWSAGAQEQTAFIACLPIDQSDGQPLHARVFTPYGRVLVTPSAGQRYYACHVTIWSGCVYRLAAVRRIGLPNANYVLDRGELEYAYRVMKAGYKAFIHQDAIIKHNIRGTPGLVIKKVQLGPIALKFFELAPIRCYYTVRNTLYFTLYDSAEGRSRAFSEEMWRVRCPPGRSHGLMSGVAWRVALLTMNFAARPLGHGAQIKACLRGIWDGVTGNVRARF